MRVVFFGTPEFALPSLKALLASRHQVVAVVTQPDKPKGRLKKPTPPPVKEAVQGSGIPILQPQKISEVALLNTLRALLPQCAVVVAYGGLLPNPILQIFANGAVNLHPSVLPKYRGAAPIQWALIQGEKETGVTIFQLDGELDHGPILLQERVPIRPEDNALSLSQTLSERGAPALVEVLDQIESGSSEPKPQDHSAATYAPRLKKEDGAIDWTMAAQAIFNRIRGLQPWPGAMTRYEGKLLKIISAAADSTKGDPNSSPGTVVTADPKEGLWVQTGQGQLQMKELQLEGGRVLQASDFLRGHPLLQGTQLGIP